MKVFLVALQLLKIKLSEEKDLKDGNYTLYYLIPGGEANDVMTKLRVEIKKAFPFLAGDDNRIKFIREPRAAA